MMAMDVRACVSDDDDDDEIVCLKGRMRINGMDGCVCAC